MQPQGLTSRLEGRDLPATKDVAGRPSRVWASRRLALMTLLVGGAVGAAAWLSFDRPATTQLSHRSGPGTPSFAAAHAAKPSTTRQSGPGTPNFGAAHAAKPSTAQQGAAKKSVRRSLTVLFPGDQDYVASSSIAVAGLAFGRPRSPRVSAVEVELLVDGRLVDHVRLDVQSSRFAGVLALSNPIGRTAAELRISDPTRPSGPTVVRHLTLDPPATP